VPLFNFSLDSPQLLNDLPSVIQSYCVRMLVATYLTNFSLAYLSHSFLRQRRFAQQLPAANTNLPTNQTNSILQPQSKMSPASSLTKGKSTTATYTKKRPAPSETDTKTVTSQPAAEKARTTASKTPKVANPKMGPACATCRKKKIRVSSSYMTKLTLMAASNLIDRLEL
jgi:hypothetical protein